MSTKYLQTSDKHCTVSEHKKIFNLPWRYSIPL